jgi:hypothetical protein
MNKHKAIEQEAQERWDAILGRDLKEDSASESQTQPKAQDETTLGRTVQTEHS